MRVTAYIRQKAKAEDLIARMKDEVARIDHDLENMTDVAAYGFGVSHVARVERTSPRTVCKAWAS